METFSWQGRDDEGQKWIFQAAHFGGWWQLERAPKLGRSQRDDMVFEPVDFDEEAWVTLRDLLWRKYQRRRVSWGMVEHIDAILAGKATNERRDIKNAKNDKFKSPKSSPKPPRR